MKRDFYYKLLLFEYSFIYLFLPELAIPALGMGLGRTLEFTPFYA